MIDLRVLCLKCNGSGERFLEVEAIEAEFETDKSKCELSHTRVKTVCDICGGRGFIR